MLYEVITDEHRVVAERRRGLAARLLQQRRQLLGIADQAHALAPATGRRLEQHREADLLQLSYNFV